LSRPFFDSFGAAGLYVIPVLSGWLIAVLAGIWAAAHEPRLGAPATLVAGLATPIAFQSVSFSEHTLATLCGAVAVTALVLAPAERVWRLAVAALVLAMVLISAAYEYRGLRMVYANRTSLQQWPEEGRCDTPQHASLLALVEGKGERGDRCAVIRIGVRPC